MVFQFCVLGSGSSGNSIAFWDSENAFLVDAGFSCRETARRLNCAGLEPKEIDAILVSHEHSDHIQGLRVISNRFDPYILSTMPVHNWLFAKCGISTEPALVPGREFTIGNFAITPFEVCHDASQTVGFDIRNGNSRVAMATDLGHVNPEVLSIFKNADAIIIESNHDVDMLKNGKYPDFLKRRILGLQGHLSNAQSADMLATAVGENTRHVTLAHLSQENNKPEIALAESETALKVAGKRADILPASQFNITDIIKLG